MVVDSETDGAAYESGELPPRSGEAAAGFRQLLGHWESWVLVIGVVAFLTTAITIQSFGPLMFTQAYHYSPAMADEVTARFWLINLVMLVPAGLFSDWLRVRKPITIVLSLVGVALLFWWVKNFFPAASACRNRDDRLDSGWSASVGIYTVVRLFFGISRRPVAGYPGDRMVVFSDGVSHVDRLLRAAAGVGRGALRLADLDVGDGGGGVLFIVSNLAVRGHWRPATARRARADGACARSGRALKPLALRSMSAVRAAVEARPRTGRGGTRSSAYPDGGTDCQGQAARAAVLQRPPMVRDSRWHVGRDAAFFPQPLHVRRPAVRISRFIIPSSAWCSRRRCAACRSWRRWTMASRDASRADCANGPARRPASRSFPAETADEVERYPEVFDIDMSRCMFCGLVRRSLSRRGDHHEPPARNRELFARRDRSGTSRTCWCPSNNSRSGPIISGAIMTARNHAG